MVEAIQQTAGQYMAGHKYIDSTEGYPMQQTNALKDLLANHRPFGLKALPARGWVTFS